MRNSTDIEAEILSRKTALPGILLEEFNKPGAVFRSGYRYLWLMHCGNAVLYFLDIWNVDKTICMRKAITQYEFIEYLINNNWN